MDALRSDGHRRRIRFLAAAKLLPQLVDLLEHAPVFFPVGVRRGRWATVVPAEGELTLIELPNDLFDVLGRGRRTQPRFRFVRCRVAIRRVRTTIAPGHLGKFASSMA